MNSRGILGMKGVNREESFDKLDTRDSFKGNMTKHRGLLLLWYTFRITGWTSSWFCRSEYMSDIYKMPINRRAA